MQPTDTSTLKNLWDRFDVKFLLCCTKYKTRYESVAPELARVGITDYIVQWDVPQTPIKDILRAHIKTNQFLSHLGPFSCCLNHYRAIKTAFELGANSCLILEDDIRFRRNLDFIRETHFLLPSDYDYAQFENVKPWEMSFQEYFSLKDKNLVNKRWRRFSNLRGGGCYALSRRAMQRMIEILELHISGKKTPLVINDYYVSQIGGINKYFCYPNVAVQAMVGDANSSVEGYWENYYHLGMRFEEYQMDGTTKPKAAQ